MDQGRRLAMSRDGTSLYVTSQTGGVAVLARSGGSGALTQPAGEAGCVISAVQARRLELCARCRSPTPCPSTSSCPRTAPTSTSSWPAAPTARSSPTRATRRPARLTFTSCVAENAGPAAVRAGARAGRRREDRHQPRRPLGLRRRALVPRRRHPGDLQPRRDARPLSQLEGAAGLHRRGAAPGLRPGPAVRAARRRSASPATAAGPRRLPPGHGRTGAGSILAEFARDSTDGALIPRHLHRPRAARAAARFAGCYGFTRVTISVDGRYMYLGGLTGTGIFAT